VSAAQRARVSIGKAVSNCHAAYISWEQGYPHPFYPDFTLRTGSSGLHGSTVMDLTVLIAPSSSKPAQNKLLRANLGFNREFMLDFGRACNVLACSVILFAGQIFVVCLLQGGNAYTACFDLMYVHDEKNVHTT
jgi:hypothetical protein